MIPTPLQEATRKHNLNIGRIASLEHQAILLIKNLHLEPLIFEFLTPLITILQAANKNRMTSALDKFPPKAHNTRSPQPKGKEKSLVSKKES